MKSCHSQFGCQFLKSLLEDDPWPEPSEIVCEGVSQSWFLRETQRGTVQRKEVFKTWAYFLEDSLQKDFANPLQMFLSARADFMYAYMCICIFYMQIDRERHACIYIYIYIRPRPSLKGRAACRGASGGGPQGPPPPLWGLGPPGL